MDQIIIGRFIADCRREKGLTQMQVAEQLGVTNRAVSKWETGKGMPDVSILQSLCGVLDISVNELLSGKRLAEAEEKSAAEGHILSLLTAKDRLGTMQILTEILVLAGIIIAVTLTHQVADTTAEKVITLLAGCFVWGYGLWMRMVLTRMRKELTK